jgi:hypothetical protein
MGGEKLKALMVLKEETKHGTGQQDLYNMVFGPACTSTRGYVWFVYTIDLSFRIYTHLSHHNPGPSPDISYIYILADFFNPVVHGFPSLRLLGA